jgi:hypothetical protein
LELALHLASDQLPETGTTKALNFNQVNNQKRDVTYLVGMEASTQQHAYMYQRRV